MAIRTILWAAAMAAATALPATAQQTGDPAARAVALFAETCLRWPGDDQAVAAAMHARHALPLDERTRTLMMPTGATDAFDATDDVARLALLTSAPGQCRVVADRGSREETARLLDETLARTDPTHDAPIDTASGGAAWTRSYEIVRNGFRYAILAWTTSAAAPYHMEMTLTSEGRVAP